MEIGRSLLLVIMWLAFAGNVMLALFLFGRVLSGLVGRLRTRLRGSARANRPDGRANVFPKSWTQGIIGVDRSACPPREGVKAQSIEGGGGEVRAA